MPELRQQKPLESFVVADLLRFAQRSAFQRAALRAVAMQATSEAQPLWRHFSALDRCGLIQVSHLEELAKQVPEPDTLHKARALRRL